MFIEFLLWLCLGSQTANSHWCSKLNVPTEKIGLDVNFFDCAPLRLACRDPVETSVLQETLQSFYFGLMAQVPSKPCSDVVFQVGERGMSGGSHHNWKEIIWAILTELSKVGSMLTVKMRRFHKIPTRSGKIHPNSCGFWQWVGKNSNLGGLRIGATLSEANFDSLTFWLTGCWWLLCGKYSFNMLKQRWWLCWFIYWMRRCARTSCIGFVCGPGEL